MLHNRTYESALQHFRWKSSSDPLGRSPFCFPACLLRPSPLPRGPEPRLPSRAPPPARRRRRRRQGAPLGPTPKPRPPHPCGQTRTLTSADPVGSPDSHASALCSLAAAAVRAKMLGFSTGQLLVILGACSVMMKPSDMVKIARTAGRMTGRAVGRLIVARRQLDEILGQSAATKVHKELKDAMTQLDTIRYEVQSLSRLTPGQFTMRQHDTGAGMAEAGKSDASDGSVTKLEEFRHEIRSIIRDEIESFYKTRPDSIKTFAASTTEARKLDVSADPMALKSKDLKMANTGSTNLHSQAVTYARLSEAPGIKRTSSLSGNYQEQFKESDGLLNVLPISAESAGLLPSRSGEPTGSDLVLEAVLEAEVASNAKIFVSQPPPDQLPNE